MNALILGAALSAGLATALVVHPGLDPGPGLRPRGAGLAGPDSPAVDGDAAGQGATSPKRVAAASLLAAGAAWLLIGGPLGVAAGAVVASGVPVLIGFLEPARVRRERLAMVRAAPLVADLLSAALLAGAPMEQSIPVVARAVGGLAGHRLLMVHRRITLGEPTALAFQALARQPGLGGVARAVVRSSRTGAPLAALLAHVAADLRAEAAAAGMEQVRGTAVRAVLPLGLCLLPAFALLGITPIVGGLLPQL